MSDEKKTAPSTPKAIHVRELQFRQPTDIPGKKQASSVQNKPEKNRSYWSIEYQPWMRHHMVTWHQPNKPDLVGFVHESAVSSWFPFLEATASVTNSK